MAQHHKHKNKTKSKELYKLEVERDGLGRIVEKTEIVKGERHKVKYSFDQAGRLVSAQGRKGFRSYSYDANGNRTFMSEGGFKHGKHYEYDSQDRLIKADDVVYRYNLNGDLVEKVGGDFEAEYFYDSLGNLKTVNFPKDIHHDKDCNKDFWRKHRKQRKDYRIDYIVDGMGRRVGKKVNGRLVQQFVWQSQLQIAAELDGQGRLVKQFVYGSKVNVPDYMLTNGRTYSIITDQLGSPRLIVDAASGKIADEIEYDEFGNVLKDSNPGFTPFGFAGGLFDQDTKLLRFGARDYDPEVGRWTTKDPILFYGGSPNIYSYTFNDPINLRDPIGLKVYDFGNVIPAWIKKTSVYKLLDSRSIAVFVVDLAERSALGSNLSSPYGWAQLVTVNSKAQGGARPSLNLTALEEVIIHELTHAAQNLSRFRTWGGDLEAADELNISYNLEQANRIKGCQ